MKISKSAGSVLDSITMAVEARAKQMVSQGIDVISFGAGEPDFDTPEFIRESAKKALDAGMTRYAPAAGTVELRKEIAGKLARENGLKYEPGQIVVTCGAKHAVYQAIHALVDAGDEVLIPTPYWVSYPEMVKLVGGVPRIVKTSQASGYRLTPELLKDSITPKSTVLLMNYPGNPGGFCYNREELGALGKVIGSTPISVISDEIYEKLVYGKAEFYSFAAACPELYGKTITINGFSKAYSMTGWRVGYLAGPPAAAGAIARMQSHMTSGPATFCQAAAAEALRNGDADIARMHGEFSKRASYIYERVKGIKGIKCLEPTGAFYVFPDVSSYYGAMGMKGSVEFCQSLLEKARVACVPGAGFGCDENIRLSFATSLELIKMGLDRLEGFLKG